MLALTYGLLLKVSTDSGREDRAQGRQSLLAEAEGDIEGRHWLGSGPAGTL